jgi:uncharacterized membrane protein
LHHLVGGGPVIHRVGAISFAGYVFIAPYPLIPWLGVMTLGFCFGPILAKPADERRRTLALAGVVAIAAFVMLRTFNIYGEPAHWSPQTSAVFSALSFLNASKYPPSLVFLLMTLGPALIALPLFYFVLHVLAAHLASFVLAVVTYGSTAFTFMWQPVPSMGGPAKAFPPNFGWDLWIAYAVWIAIVIALYPLCARFARFKERSAKWWLSYL